MKYIVTGSEGFIGKSLAAFLRRRGDTVIPIDRRGLATMVYRDGHADTLISSEAGELTADNLRTLGIDVVFHLAAQTSVFNGDVRQICRDNIAAFIEVATACHEAGVKLVYASSSTANPCNTTSLYGISKRFDEEFAAIYCPSATGVRFHNVYGPNPRQGTLLWHILNDKRVVLYNQGRNVRHYTYIGDIIDGLVYAADCDKRLVNIANPEEMSVYDYAVAVADELQRHNDSHGTDFTLDIHLTRDRRDRDNFAQSVDESIFTVPLQYTTVADGMRHVFSDPGTLDTIVARDWG